MGQVLRPQLHAFTPSFQRSQAEPLLPFVGRFGFHGRQRATCCARSQSTVDIASRRVTNWIPFPPGFALRLRRLKFYTDS